MLKFSLVSKGGMSTISYVTKGGMSMSFETQFQRGASPRVFVTVTKSSTSVLITISLYFSLKMTSILNVKIKFIVCIGRTGNIADANACLIMNILSLSIIILSLKIIKKLFICSLFFSFTTSGCFFFFIQI